MQVKDDQTQNVLQGRHLTKSIDMGEWKIGSRDIDSFLMLGVCNVPFWKFWRNEQIVKNPILTSHDSRGF